MHGAHPGHLAFKLLDRLSLSSCFSPSLLSVPSLVASLPFSLSHVFERACTPPAFPRSSTNAQLLSSPFVSRNIAPSHNFPTVPLNLTFLYVTRCISLFFIPSGDTVIRARTCFLCVSFRKRRLWRGDDKWPLLAAKYL